MWLNASKKESGSVTSLRLVMRKAFTESASPKKVERWMTRATGSPFTVAVAYTGP